MSRFLSAFFGKSEKTASSIEPATDSLQQYDEEYIRYCIELEQTVSGLEAYLHTSDDPKEIAIQTLKTANEFYGGSWAGILDVDLELDAWTASWWYNPGKNDRTEKLLAEIQTARIMPNWIHAMHNNEPLILHNVETVKKDEPEEYRIYQMLGIKSVIASPFAPNPVGFLAVRNPTRYIDRPSMMSILAYVLHRAMAQQKTLESAKKALSPEAIRSDKDIIINFFGSMELCTSQGVIREQDFKSPKASRVATYLMLHRKASHPPMEIASALWPEENPDPEAVGRNIRSLIYRFRREFSLISPHQLIESTPNGYRINPELHIITDLQQFDTLWERAQKAGAASHKIELLKQAVALYRGPLFENAAGEHWIVGLATHYSMRYAGLINELLSALAEIKDYSSLQLYATKACDIMPENIKARYWLIYAIYHLGAVEVAKSEIERAKTILTPEEFTLLSQYIERHQEMAL